MHRVRPHLGLPHAGAVLLGAFALLLLPVASATADAAPEEYAAGRSLGARSTHAATRATRGRRTVVHTSGSRTALQLAAVKGLRYTDYRTYVLLEDPASSSGVTSGVRVRIYPGTNVVVVAGKEYRVKDRTVRTRNDLHLTSRVCSFLSMRIDSYRIRARARASARKAGERKLEPLPPLPERRVIAKKPPKVDVTATARPVEPRRARPMPAGAGRGWVPNATERPWRWIVLHHSDDESGDMAKYDAYHRNEKRWENGCGYHFVVGNGSLSGDGEVEIGPRWPRQLQGAHAKVPGNRFNERGIGICLVGDFDTGAQRPSAAQMDALVHLVRWLKQRYDIDPADIRGHCDCCSTCCPGKNFPWAQFRRRIAH